MYIKIKLIKNNSDSIIIELKKEKVEVIRAAVVVGGACPPNKAVLTSTDGPLVKPDFLFN